MKTYQVMCIVGASHKVVEEVSALTSAIAIVAALTKEGKRAWVMPLAPTVREFKRTGPKPAREAHPSTRYSFVKEKDIRSDIAGETSSDIRRVAS